jgi:hypothetical protein
MAYIYRHLRLDKNEVFYIGIGSDKNYKRAFSHCNRNRYWHFVVSNTDYEVEILLDDITWEQACKKEKEFIKLYGRKDLKEGTLVNMTDGGEGLINPSIEVLEKLKQPKTEDHKNKISLYHADFSGAKNPMYGKGYLFKGEKNPFYGKKHSKDTLEKLKKPKTEDHKNALKEKWKERKDIIIECPHCKKIGGINIKKYHFKNCKFIKQIK